MEKNCYFKPEQQILYLEKDCVLCTSDGVTTEEFNDLNQFEW